MIPKNMHDFLKDVLPKNIWENRLIREEGRAFLEFGPLDVDSLLQLGIKVDKLGPRLVACMWDEKSPLEIGGYLVVDNLAMGQPSMGGIRMLPDISPSVIYNLARGMTLKNAAADLPFGGGKSGIVSKSDLPPENRLEVIKGFARLLAKYTEIYIPGPDVGTNDADMKTIAIENGLNNAVSKPVDMGGNRIDELGGAANGVVVAAHALLEHIPKLKQLPQFRDMEIPDKNKMDVLIQGFGAVGAHVARIFDEYDPDNRPIIKGISDDRGYLYSLDSLPWEELFKRWEEKGRVTEDFFRDNILNSDKENKSKIIFSNSYNNLLMESAFCLVPASPVFNYLDVDESTNPSMTVDRMGKWRIIVEGANSYSPDPIRKAERRRMERAVYRDNGTLIATDYLVNSGGVIYAAHERIIPTPEHLWIPEKYFGKSDDIEKWLNKNSDEFTVLAEKRRKAAVEKLEKVIRKNMEELVDGLCEDHDSLPCEISEKISIKRIALKEKSRKVADIMEKPPRIDVNKSLKDAAKLLIDSYSPIVTVVSQKDKLIGIVTEWDITKAAALGTDHDNPLTTVMTADVVTIEPDCTIIDCIRRLERFEISAMPVVEDNKVVGVISGDILARRTLYRLLQAGE
jgi:glutamate dehydrogenase (NAD(P)+)